MSSPWRLFADHLRLTVRLTPNGGRDAFDGIETDSEGETYLRARVTAVREKGKANKALIALVSKSVGVAKSRQPRFRRNRKKILRIEGDPEDLAKKLETLSG
ncbi:DUF167 domain-containing protein [Rhizobium mulingense]|uniref:DUF167 domain-containing protein n=1 Tax=Rhizobium mulingense TaxID=3031128 RepID=UPI002B492B0B|nr:DUF167 domain-containing protein [Rhizobium sp. MJ21]MEB3044478.1 DUF167 domain-containing protein [Rhizobium sp. MJ21]